MTLKFDRTKLTKNLAKGSILIPFLDRAFDTFDEPFTFAYEEKQIDDAWHPSGDCVPKVTDLYESRLEAYTALSEGRGIIRADREISGSLRKSFMVGHYWHQVLQYIILNKLEFCKPEAIESVGTKGWGLLEVSPDRVPWLPYHWARGQGDIAPLETPKWKGVVDIKTMSSGQFKLGALPIWAKAKYTAQINIYMDLFQEDHAMILAVNKDAPHDFREFTFERDQELIDAIYDKWQYVSECFVSGKVPTEEDNERFVLPI